MYNCVISHVCVEALLHEKYASDNACCFRHIWYTCTCTSAFLSLLPGTLCLMLARKSDKIVRKCLQRRFIIYNIFS